MNDVANIVSERVHLLNKVAEPWIVSRWTFHTE
jgi:hypothetical protein